MQSSERESTLLLISLEAKAFALFRVRVFRLDQTGLPSVPQPPKMQWLETRLQSGEKAKELRPDVCLFDIRMPEMGGIEATSALADPNIADPLTIVIITTFDSDEHEFKG